jgi:Ser/Thr protein kinase RdoA (MazF antagonist)
VAEAFGLTGGALRVEPFGSGHIHETCRAVSGDAGRQTALLVQRINTSIFRDPGALMENLQRVTTHLQEKLAARGSGDLERRCLRVVPTRDGGLLHVDEAGAPWRAFRFIPGTRAFETMESPAQAYETARAFGDFAALLADLPAPPLHDTLPAFHDLGARFEAFERALDGDARQRASALAPEIASVREGYEDLAGALEALGFASLPRRVVHHDCKLNNLLFDAASGEALCVVDLDTVMGGTLLSDFGELVRSGSCRAPEDARDLDSVRFELDLFEALARGYRAGARDLLCEAELRGLPIAGRLLTLMNAMRFLTDHLAGDVYFRVHREGQNLERARAQLRLAQHMREAQPEVERLVEDATEAASPD